MLLKVKDKVGIRNKLPIIKLEHSGTFYRTPCWQNGGVYSSTRPACIMFGLDTRNGKYLYANLNDARYSHNNRICLLIHKL